MNKLNGDDLIIEPIDDKFFYITKEEHFSDIKSFELGFDNDESIFIPADKVIDYFFQVVNLVDVVEDNIFNKGYVFRRGCLKIAAKTYLSDMLGKDYFDIFIKKAELNNIKVEYNNDYPIHSNIPFMLMLPSDDAGVVRSYSEEDGVFIIYWNYEKLM